MIQPTTHTRLFHRSVVELPSGIVVLFALQSFVDMNKSASNNMTQQ